MVAPIEDKSVHVTRVTAKEAAAHAGVSERTIWAWAKKHKLTRHACGNNTLFDLGEVNAVIDADDRFIPTPQLVAVLFRRIERLERQLDVLNYTSGTYSPLALTGEQAEVMHAIAERQSRRERIPPEEYEGLVVMCEGITEEILEQIMGMTGEIHPWKAFYHLVTHLQQQLLHKRDLKKNLDYQSLLGRLCVVRSRLRDMALIFIESDLNAPAREELLASLGPETSLEREIISRVIWNKRPGRSGKFEALSEDPEELLAEAVELMEEKDKVTVRQRIVKRLNRVIEYLKK